MKRYVRIRVYVSLNSPTDPPIVAPLVTFATIHSHRRIEKGMQVFIISFGEDGVRGSQR